MQRTSFASILLTAAALLNVGPILAQTVAYSGIGTTIANSEGSLIQAQDGRLYGTAVKQSDNGGLDFNFTLGSSFNYNVYSFGGLTDGGLPVGSLIQGADSTMFGTASFGGANGFGVLYNLTGNFSAATGTQTPVYAFTGATDGANPQGSLIIDNAGNFYGTAANIAAALSSNTPLVPIR